MDMAVITQVYCQLYMSTTCFGQYNFWPSSGWIRKMGQCSETSAYKIQTPGNYPEERIQHSEHGENLKSGIKPRLYRTALKKYRPCLHASGNSTYHLPYTQVVTLHTACLTSGNYTYHLPYNQNPVISSHL